MKNLLTLVTCTAIVAGAPAQMSYQTFSNMQRVAGVSRDGNVIVFDAGPVVYRWTAANGFQTVHTIGWGRHDTYAVSGDASTLLGTYEGKFLQGQYRWSLADGIVNGPYGRALSYDGSITVGSSGSNPVKWIGQSGPISLTTLPGGASAVSDDGSTIFGTVLIANVARLFRWRSSTGIELLNTPTSSLLTIRQVSADGRVAVGLFREPNGSVRAFRWAAENGLQIVPLPPGFTDTRDVVISPCGSVIGGMAELGNWRGAYYWTQAGGPVMLRQAFYDAGLWPLMSMNPPQTVTAIQVLDGKIRLYGEARGNVFGTSAAYIATVVPEPATLLSLGGLMAATLMRRRRHLRGDAASTSDR